MQKLWRMTALVICLVLLVPFVVACSTPFVDDGTLRIVCTIFPQYDIATHIAGERAQCVMLLETGNTDSHAWEPTIRQLGLIADADLFLAVGGESESWTTELLAACEVPEEKVLRMLTVVEGMSAHDDHDHDHEHEHLDEHVWTDPQNMVVIAHAVADLLCATDPAGAAYYRQNEAAYVAELTALVDAYHAALDDAPQKTIVVADKFPFRYLAHAYGLTYYAAFPGCASDTEPSLQTIYQLRDVVERESLPVVLYVTHSSKRIADVVCEGTGRELRGLHACHTISAAELAAGETYCSLMEQNLNVLKEALGICNS